jgi:fucose permease
VASAVLAMLLIASAALRAPLGSPSPAAAAAQGGLPSRFWLYAAATLLYGVVETLGGNWATLYLVLERHVAARDASLALSAFWLMVTIGRVVFALGGRWLPAKWVYVALPIALALVFQFAAHVEGVAAGIAAFAAAGFACSAMLPLSLSFGGAEFPGRTAAMSGALIAFYQVGYGVAAFGVGPLHERGGVAYSTAYSVGGAVALILAAVAYGVVRRPAQA